MVQMPQVGMFSHSVHIPQGSFCDGAAHNINTPEEHISEKRNSVHLNGNFDSLEVLIKWGCN